MIDPDQLQALSAAVTEGTFEAAARMLHVTPSAISQRIKALETAVGRVLLVRTKPVRPTESGNVLLRAAQQIDAVSTEALHALGHQSSGASRVALAVNADTLATWLIPALAELQDAVVFDLHREDETRTADLLRDGTVMAAVTASALPVPGCTVQPLGTMRYRPRAAPGFAARWFGDGATVEALSRAPLIAFGHGDEVDDRYLRRRTRRRLMPPRHYVPDSTAAAEAIRLGLGWGSLPDIQVGHGSFVEFDPDAHIDVRLYWQQWRLRSTTLDHVAATIRRHAQNALR